MSKERNLKINFADVATTPKPVTGYKTELLFLRIIRQNSFIAPDKSYVDIPLTADEFFKDPNIVWKKIREYHKTPHRKTAIEQFKNSQSSTIGFQVVKQSKIILDGNEFTAKPEAITPEIYYTSKNNWNIPKPEIIKEENFKHNFRAGLDDELYAVQIPKGSFIVPFGYNLEFKTKTPQRHAQPV